MYTHFRVPIETGKPGDLNFILSRSRNGLEFVPKSEKYQDKTRNLAENLDKTWNVNIYKISILYCHNFFYVLYSCEFRMSFVSAFWCQNCPHYNLENNLLTWRKPGANLEFYDLNKLGTLSFKCWQLWMSP